MIPIAAFERAEEALRRLEFPLTSHVSHGLGHSIDIDGLRLGGAFLLRVLG
jgi:phospholipase/carboxylesterase